MTNRIMNGVIQVTGEHDVGKTTFALECGADPSRILFFDDDLKGKNSVADLEESGVKLGGYINLIDQGYKLVEYDFHLKVMEIIHAIKPDQYDAIIWDTWTHFADTTYSYVLRHPDEFRKNWAPMGSIKGPQQWKEARRYEAMIINYLSTLAPTVILVTHLKSLYIGQAQVPGKYVPANSNALDRTMRMRLWLRLNPSGRPVPIGLVMKRLDRKINEDGKIRTVNVLPRKLVPYDNEHSLWDTIWNYWDEPMGDREPGPDEIPDEYELSILDGTLTKEQTRTLMILAQSGLMEEMSMDPSGRPTPDELAKIIQLQDEGVPLNIIAKQVNLPLVKIQDVLNRLPAAGEEINFRE